MPSRAAAARRGRLDTLPCVILRSLAAFFVACASWPATAVLIRPDRDDAEYLELASHYTSSIVLSAPASEAVVIASRWVLLPASHAKGIAAGGAVDIGGRPYPVVRVATHPDARPGSPADLALVQLGSAVRGVEPTPVYRGHDEAGKGLVLVAHGATGKIGDAARTRDGRARGAINTIERLSPLTASVPLKELEEASDLLGVLVPGEEGAPAYIQTGEGLFVAGLYYGDVTVWNLLSRLSAFAPWIDAVRVAAERDDQEKMLEDRPR